MTVTLCEISLTCLYFLIVIFFFSLHVFGAKLKFHSKKVWEDQLAVHTEII